MAGRGVGAADLWRSVGDGFFLNHAIDCRRVTTSTVSPFATRGVLVGPSMGGLPARRAESAEQPPLPSATRWQFASGGLQSAPARFVFRTKAARSRELTPQPPSQERCDILRGCHASLEAGAAAASDGGDGGWTALLEASASVLANAEIEGKAWQDLAEGELPQEKLAEGEVCYTCGGDHSNRDCWLERRTRSPAASAFINSLKQRSDPAPSAAECLATAIPW